MTINPFKLERFFAQYEFKVKYLFSSSDCESLTLNELLEMAAPESLELWQGLRLGYTESAGHPFLRNEIARLYQRISPEQTLVAAPEEAIFIAMQTLLKPGEHVLVVHPVYQSLSEVARSIQCEITSWPLKLEGNRWCIDLNQLEASITGKTRMLVINFPHNPTGHTLTRYELQTIIDLARQHNLYLFSDEMYRLLELEPAIRLPAVCDLYEKGVSLSGLSKAFALPGLRLGWLATRQSDLIERWLAFKDYTTICNSAPGEILGIIALQNMEKILQRSLNIVRANTTLAEQFFNHYQDHFTWLKPLAGSIAFPRWLGAQPVEQFCAELLDQQGVMIVPGSLFDYPGSHFRIGLGRKNFGEALGRLEEYVSRG
jgi:aspartate/methionine/tyrosine aminotransferase